MGRITLVLGGARSGKSTFATKQAIKHYKNVAYVATSPYYDDAMKERIEQHKKDRPGEWPTYEQTKELHELIQQVGCKHDLLLIDCLTLYVSTYMLEGAEESVIQEKVKLMLEALKKTCCDTIIVSNEVGLSVHPENEMALDFRDYAGRANQIVAAASDHVYFMIAGIPMHIKGAG